MSLPGKPIIRNAPRASPNILEYYWFPPADTGGNPIEGYQLSLDPGGITCNVSASQLAPTFGYYKITGLSNATTYFTTIAASTINGYGPTANFRAFQPGSPPTQRVATASVVTVGFSNALVRWLPPAVLPDATIFWYTLTSRSTNSLDKVFKITANGQLQSNYFVRGLNSNSYYDFIIRPVNCPGYGPSNITNFIQFPLSFTPTRLQNNQLWFDGADPLGTGSAPSSGTFINTWTDKSGNSRNATAVTTNTSRYLSDGLGTAIDFNGSTARYDVPNTTLAPAVANQYFTEFLVEKLGRNNNGEQVMFGTFTGGAQNSAVSVRYQGTNATNVEFGFVNNDLLATSGITGFSSCNAQPYRIWSMSFLPQNRTQYLNGTSIVSDTNNLQLTGWNAPTIGAGYGGNFYGGRISEILFYTGVITPFNRQKVEGYLAQKWGLTGNLPTTHPFRTAAPTMAVFTPTILPNLQFWIDAADTSSITLVDSAVSQWNDKSGNNYHLTQTVDANRPPYNTVLWNSNVHFLNDDYMNIPQAAINNATQYTLFFVFTPVSSTNWIFVKQHDGNNTYNALSMTRNNTNSVNTLATTQLLYYRSLNAGGLANSSSVLNVAQQIISLRFDGTNLVMYRNGVQLSSTAGTFAISNITNATNFTLGAWILNSVIQNTGVTNFRLNEMLFYSRSLVDPDRQTVEGYLAWKWNLEYNLIFSHPYKFSNPLVPITRTVWPGGLMILLNAREYIGSGQWINTGSLGTSANAANNAGTIVKNGDGNGIVIGGTTTYIIPPSSTVGFGTITGYTISIWFKLTVTAGNNQSILRAFSSGANVSFNIVKLPANGENEFCLTTFNGTTLRSGPLFTFPINGWVNFCVTNNGTSIINYVNGQPRGTATTSGIPAMGGGIFIGYDGTSTILSGGEIGQILYYNRVLTASQIQDNYIATFANYN